MARFSVSTEFTAKSNRFNTGVDKMGRKLNRFQRIAGTGLDKATRAASGLASGLKKVGIAATAAAGVTGLAMKQIVGVGASFEKELISAAIKFPEKIRQGTEAFTALEATAERVGATTEFSASQAASGLKFLAKAGFDAKQAIGALPGVIDLSTAAQMDLGQASDIATDVLGAFGLVTKNSTQLQKNLARVTDVMSATADSSTTSIELLFETMKNAGPIAKATGSSIETFAALTGTLAAAGLKGSDAGTTLKNVFSRLAAPPTEAAKAIKKLGLETLDASGNLRDVPTILGELNKSLEGLGTGERSGILKDIFGLRAVAGANILLESGQKNLEKFRIKLEGAGGSVKDVAATMRKATQGDIDSFKSAFESIEIGVFKALKPDIKSVVKSITELFRQKKPAIVSAFKEMLSITKRLNKAFSGDFTKTLETFGTSLDGILSGDPKAGEQRVKTLESLARVMGRLAAIGVIVLGAFVKLENTLHTVLGVLFKPAEDAFNKMKAFFEIEGLTLTEKLLKLGKAMIIHLADGILSAANVPVDAIKRISGSIIDGMTKVLEFGSPSKVMTDRGAMISQGLANGMLNAIPKVHLAADKLAAAAFPNIKPFDAMIRTNVGGLNSFRGPSLQDREAPQVITPSQQSREAMRDVLREESSQRHDIFLHDPSGRAEVKPPKKSGGVGIRLVPSGAP